MLEAGVWIRTGIEKVENGSLDCYVFHVMGPKFLGKPSSEILKL